MTIKEVIEKEIKGTWGKEPVEGQNNTPVIKTNNMSYEGMIDYNELTLRNIDPKKVDKFYLKKGDLLIEKSGGTKYHSVGYVNYFDNEDNKYVCNNFILALRPNLELIYPKYLFYYIKYLYENEKFYDCYNKTTGIQNLNVEAYLSKEIKLKDMDSQKKISKELDEIVKSINIKEQSIAHLDELIKSRFIEMFDNKGYPILKWNDVFNTTTGKLDSNAMIEGGQYPFFTCAKEVFAIDKYAFDQEALLLAGNNAAGKYDVKYYKGKFNAYQRTYVLDLKQNWSYQLFRYQLENKLEWLREQSKGCNTRYITLKILGELEFIIPPFEDQMVFERFCNQIDKSKFYLQNDIIDLKELLNKKAEAYFGE